MSPTQAETESKSTSSVQLLVEAAVAKLVLPELRSIAAKMEEIAAKINKQRKEFYPVDEFASLMGRSAYTIRQWIGRGQLKAERVAGTGPKGRFLIPHSELQRMIGEGKGAEIPHVAL